MRNFIAAVGIALSTLAAFSLNVVSAAPANPVPTTYAYGPAGQAIAPLYGGLLGSYSVSLNSGTIAAGASAAAPVFSFQYTGSNLAVIKRVVISAGDAGTAFAAGTAVFNMFVARSYSAADTGGTAATLTGNNGKLRTSFPTTAVGSIMIATTGALTAGTYTEDSQPGGSVAVATPATAGQALLSNAELWSAKNAGDYPMVFANNEGFEIQATVPATGTWKLTVTVVWDEYSAY